MIFPIGDDNIKGGVKPILTYGFIALNVLVYFLFQNGLSQVSEGNFYATYAADPCEIRQGKDLYALITSMFLHGGIMHLLGNMLYLWIFGDNIETTIGNLRYLFFYLSGGIFAALAHVYLGGTSDCIPMVGASGAISALIGAYLIMFPKSRIKMIFILYLKPFYIPAYVFILFWIFQQFSGVLTANDNVAYWAHIGGLVFGIILGLYFRLRYPKIQPFVPDNKATHYKTIKQNPVRYNNRFRRRN